MNPVKDILIYDKKSRKMNKVMFSEPVCSKTRRAEARLKSVARKEDILLKSVRRKEDTLLVASELVRNTYVGQTRHIAV